MKHKPTFDHEFIEKKEWWKIKMPSGWSPGRCNICYFKSLSRCRFFLDEYCPLIIAKRIRKRIR